MSTTQTDEELIRTSTLLALAWITVFLVASLGLITFGETLMHLFA